MDFFKDITEDTVILTPNRRLSATLHKLYQQYQIGLKKTFWQTPQFLPITTWLHQLFRDYSHQSFKPVPLLLNTAQEQYLWEKIILSTRDHEQLLQITETADLARSAFVLLIQWNVALDHPLFESSEDYKALYNWIKAFQKTCHENHWIDNASLPALIMEKIENEELDLPSVIMTYGFTEFSPQQKQLFSICEQAGSLLNHLKVISNKENGRLISLTDDELELETIARWAKSLRDDNPAASIGCVVPKLDKIRDRVVQIFSQIFAADNTYTVDNQSGLFNISAGKSLSHYPVIHTALQILSLNKKSISLETLNSLLATPFIGEADNERIRRAHFDNELRTNNKSIINLEAIAKEENKNISLDKACPLLAKRIRKLMKFIDENQEIKSYTAWVKVFYQMLEIMGWPGERSLISDEYQMVETWFNLLTEFSSLDQVAKPANLTQALHSLKKMAANHIFQPKSPDANIQVLGILEAAGLPFDYLWVAGMDDISFPPQPKPNPFIPKRLQRELQMPHATAERELNFCKIITQQFLQSVPEVIFSHAEKMQDLELQASPLVRNFTRIATEELQLKNYINPAEKVFNAKDIEWIIDDKAPFIGEHEEIRGGVSIIRQQALCPFKSFSEWRLHAHEVESPLPGLRSKDRGTVVHKSLELVWNKLEHQQNLNSLDQTELDKIINESVETALNLVPNSHSEFTQYITLEKKRLYNLIHDWLKIEKQRPPFKLLTNEKSIPFKLGPLDLTIRIDRIDELEDGSKFIVDYKTGKNNEISNWFSERPEEPQLPLYALLDPENISGISFAQVHAGEHCFKGVSHSGMDIKGIKLISELTKHTTALSWSQQLTLWREILTQLSTDFYQGVAKVDPRNAEQTCAWCALKSLCRINEECSS